MNRDLVRVYEEKKMNYRWDLPPVTLSLEEIVIGDVDKRDENRENFLAKILNRHIDVVLQNS